MARDVDVINDEIADLQSAQTRVEDKLLVLKKDEEDLEAEMESICEKIGVLEDELEDLGDTDEVSDD